MAAQAAVRRPGLQLAFETAFEAMLVTVDRRDRLERAIAKMAADSEFTPVVRRLGCLRGVSTLTAFGLAVEIGDWHRFTGPRSAPTSAWSPPNSSGATRVPGRDHQDRQRPRPPAARGSGLAPPPPYRPGRDCSAAGTRTPGSPGARAGRQPAAARSMGSLRPAQETPVIANAAIARELAGWCWSLAVIND